MEFNFDLNDYVANEQVIKVDCNLLPELFSGDRRASVQCSTVIHEVLDDMGVASAKAQGLQKPITSGDKLRNSDHTLYLLMEQENEKKSVVGLLKIGPKNLFVYDERGRVHEKKAMCVLDFYVHESKQRMGHGKVLYDYMLQDIGLIPQHLAIDKPSENLLSFLYKHYGMKKMIPQTNNFVTYDGFFDTADKVLEKYSKPLDVYDSKLMYETESNHNYVDRHSLFDNEYGLSKYGRHAAYKPTSSVGQCMSWDWNGRDHPDVVSPAKDSTNGEQEHEHEHSDLHNHTQLW